jgi:hypothetical protein
VVRYSRASAHGFVPFERDEVVVPVEQIEAAAIGLVTGGLRASETAGATITDDVLVCTHGKRDACCGTQGVALFRELSADSRLGDTVRLWRTSHTGGHRFAPTAIVLPQGTAWAFMDPDAMQRIVGRHGPLVDLLPRYRGCVGIGPRPLQAIEREAFGEIGWDWLDWCRWGEELGDGRVRLTGEAPGGERRTWEATVEIVRNVPVPDCGKLLSDAKKSEPEFALRDLRAM